MAQTSDDRFAIGDEPMPAQKALQLLEARLSPVAGVEEVPLRRACGRILARDLVSGLDVPRYDNSAVDGYAFYFDDLDPDGETRLPVSGRIGAGHPLARPPRRGEALRVFTGAPMPSSFDEPGPDTVIMQEDCREEDGFVIIPPGTNRGSNLRCAGEDIVAGATILKRGRRLRPQDVGLAASIGETGLNVFQPLRVAVFSSGDEVRDPGQELTPGAIYDANRYSLFALIEQLGCAVTDLGILPDRLDVIRDALAQAAQSHDLLITSGGVSVGDEDYVRAAVEALGKLHFWRLAIKPGRPIALGQVGKVPFLGLPGNPVAVMVTFLRLARPVILKLSGCTEIAPHLFRVRAAFAHKKKPGRLEWLRASLRRGAEGELLAHKYPHEGSGVLSSMVAADGLVELPEDLTHLEEGNMVDFLPFREVFT